MTTIGFFKRRVARLSQDTEPAIRVGIRDVISDAAQKGALGNDRLAFAVVAITRVRAEEGVEEIAKLFEQLGRDARPVAKQFARTTLTALLDTVKDLGKQGPAFQGSRDALIDRENGNLFVQIKESLDLRLEGAAAPPPQGKAREWWLTTVQQHFPALVVMMTVLVLTLVTLTVPGGKKLVNQMRAAWASVAAPVGKP